MCFNEGERVSFVSKKKIYFPLQFFIPTFLLYETPRFFFSFISFIFSYFFTNTEVIGFIEVTKIMPNITAERLGIIIIAKFEIPEIFKAVTSSLFFIREKNKIPDIKIINGNIL